jgi:acyl-CoA thioesterase-1
MFRLPSIHRARHLLVLVLIVLSPAAYAARTILVFGDSLSAGYGIRQEAAWPSLLAKRLQEKQLDYNVVNASISGETTSGGHSRLDAALNKHKPAIVVIALGSNDGLRGLPISTLRERQSTHRRPTPATQLRCLRNSVSERFRGSGKD